ncbi:MAG: undecaprenyl/decaprenyl-phosphate alpha-N-acetylglucosaminyl 1-phosphate transferase [Sedimentisphaerales bacterium]|nr:undecaprenyl/decaprenyl-phosphate alpha-N-acetylglucosaminyl 1-phosphate transferase [Sedimentisphaerales bacterium]
MFSKLNIIGPERPITWVLEYWPVLVTSLVSTLAATALCKKIAIKYGIVDKPDDTVKTHKEPIAYLGGLGMLIGLTAGIFSGLFIVHNEQFGGTLKWLFGILAGGSIACFVGLADDILDIKPWQKIVGQVCAALVLIAVGIVPNISGILAFLHLPIGGALERALQGFIVVFFVLGATNSLNLLDGLDGLCAGVTAVITLAMLVLSIHLATWGFSDIGDPVRITICLGLVGGVFGFLPFNRYPAKIFMGDAGSMLLGFTVAALMMLFAEGTPRWWFAAIAVFGLPILDTATALVRRLLNKRPLFVSDRGHIYDQMIDRGLPLKKTVAICYLLTAFYAVIGVFMGITTGIRTVYAVFIYAGVFIVSGLIIWKQGYLKMEGLRGLVPHKSKDIENGKMD